VERRSIDYSWIILIVIAVIAIFAYKPVVGYLRERSSQSTGATDYQKAKEVFYDYQVWGHPNRSCAMCHAKDYEVNPEHPDIDMPDFKYVQLKGVARKYHYTLLGSPSDLVKRINRCLHSPTRIGYGTLTQQDERIRLLLIYLKKL